MAILSSWNNLKSASRLSSQNGGQTAPKVAKASEIPGAPVSTKAHEAASKAASKIGALFRSYEDRKTLMQFKHFISVIHKMQAVLRANRERRSSFLPSFHSSFLLSFLPFLLLSSFLQSFFFLSEPSLTFRNLP
jgi:hypothetical protein